MRRWALLVASMMLVACSTSSWAPLTSSFEAHRLVQQADTQLRAGNAAAAVRILDDVVRRFPDAPNHDEALYDLARALVISASGGREYRQAAACLDRLLHEHPTSSYAVDARALRLALGAYATRAAENDRLLERLKAIDLEFDRPRQP